MGGCDAPARMGGDCPCASRSFTKGDVRGPRAIERRDIVNQRGIVSGFSVELCNMAKLGKPEWTAIVVEPRVGHGAVLPATISSALLRERSPVLRVLWAPLQLQAVRHPLPGGRPSVR